MSTLAGALGRGLAGYAANRERAMAREEELAQQRRAEARQAMLDERQRVQMEAQAQAMKEQRERQMAQDARQSAMDDRENFEGGYRSQDDTRREAGAVRDAAPSVSGMGPNSALMSMGAKTMAAGLDRRASEAPAFTMGGKPMVKSAMSLAQQTADAQAQQRSRERSQDYERQDARDVRENAQTVARDRESRAFQSSENAKSRAATMAAATARGSAGAAASAPRMTEAQRRVGGLVEIAEAERKNLEQLGTPSKWDRAMAQVPFGLGDGLMTDRGQQYMAASEAFARPYLYAVSGAAASDKEARANARQAIPGPFATKGTQDEMTARRARLVGGMRTIAGQPGDRVSRDESAAAAAFRANAIAEGYSDEEIDAELRRRGMR